MNFPEIQTEYDFYTLQLYGKKIPLVYRIRQYQKIKKQDKHYVNRLKKQGQKIKHYRNMTEDGEVEIVYYKVYCIKLVSPKMRKQLIDKVLNITHELGHKVWEEIEQKWHTTHAHKTKDVELIDRESMILDVLATYYIGGFEGKDILNQKTWEKIKNNEFQFKDKSFTTYFDNGEQTKQLDSIFETGKVAKNWTINATTEQRKKRFEELNKKQVKRWKNSTTYKQNSIYSFNNHKDKEFTWNWWKWEWVGLDLKYHWVREGLIDSDRPYKAKWCYVDAKNQFQFEGTLHEITDLVKEYKYDKDIVDVTLPEDDYYSMDQILVMQQDGQTYYYDLNINSINPTHIKILNKSG